MRTLKRGILAVVLMMGTTACLDLDVVNQNNPDIARALRDPADVETVISSSFNIWFNTYMQNDFSRVYSHISDHSTTTSTNRGVAWAEEPRLPFNNDPQGDPVWIPRAPWDSFSECVANTNDGLRRINEGLVIRTIDTGASSTTDNTDRAYTFAKLLQGLCLGALSLTNDQIAAAQEDTIVPAGYDNQIEWERTHLKPYTQIAQMAINSLDQAIARATTGAAFTTPLTWINQVQYTNVQLAELANTIAARTLVLSPRTPAERGAVNWQKVLDYTAKGLTYDFGPTLQSGILTSNNWANLVNLQTSTQTSEYRTDYKYIGPADQSGNYQKWLNTNPADRTPFYLSTPDRRVMAAAPGTCVGAPTTAACSPTGAYFRNRGEVTIFSAARPAYFQSYYGYYKRRNAQYGGGVAFSGTSGQFVMASADENRLLRAEALLRTGNVQGAVDLINVSRTRQVRITATPINNLPAIPPTTSQATRVPSVNGECVPRKNDGTCGDIMDALIWERKMELHSLDNVMWWAYARGVPGLLLPGTLLHMPIPGRYLVSMKLPIYTHGGLGGTGAAQ